MIQAWLIYDQEGASINEAYIKWFREEADKQEIKMKLVIRDELMVGIIDRNRALLMNGKVTEPPDIAVVRTIDPLLSALLEEMGVLVFNSATISRICNHKGFTHHEIQKLSIPMIDTFFYTRHTLPENPPLAFPFVIKNVHGKGGKEVFFIEDETDWIRQQAYFAQEIILQTTDVQIGKDIRVFVMGKEIVAAVLRESSGDFRANYTLGGSATLYHLGEHEKKIIEQICNHFDFDLVGIDFLIGKDGEILFNEIEDIVGSRTLSKLTDINLLELYCKHIRNKWNKKQNSSN